MLIIRQAQWTAMLCSRNSDYVVRALGHLRWLLPEFCESRSDSDIRALIAETLDRATKYGLRTEFQVTAMLDLVCLFGRDFESSEWAMAILKDGTSSADEKVTRLYDAAATAMAGRSRRTS